MAGCVVQMWFYEDKRVAKDPRLNGQKFLIVETDHPDFGSFLDEVDQRHDRIICVTRLDTHWGRERGERVIHNRAPIAFRGRELKHAELPTWRIVEEVGEGENAS